MTKAFFNTKISVNQLFKALKSAQNGPLTPCPLPLDGFALCFLGKHSVTQTPWKTVESSLKVSDSVTVATSVFYVLQSYLTCQWEVIVPFPTDNKSQMLLFVFSFVQCKEIKVFFLGGLFEIFNRWNGSLTHLWLNISHSENMDWLFCMRKFFFYFLCLYEQKKRKWHVIGSPRKYKDTIPDIMV